MSTPNPLDAINRLVEALNNGDLDNALSAYETGASLIVQPGQVATGTAALRAALSGFIALRPKMTTETHQVIQSGNIAQYLSRWSLKGHGPDGNEVHMSGTSCDILRQQPDGRWLIALDNPWGTAVLN